MRNYWLFTIVAILTAGADAQWLNFPTPGIPRTKDGKPNLSAPTPRAPDGKPDLSGVWMHETTTVADVRRIFGTRFDGEIAGSLPGMEIGTQHKYAFGILRTSSPRRKPCDRKRCNFTGSGWRSMTP